MKCPRCASTQIRKNGKKYGKLFGLSGGDRTLSQMKEKASYEPSRANPLADRVKWSR
ncbi:hypothetical protein [Nostoc sp.]|uniref:hypothetical protein n=1 Tax=Nostoc sp. TaxID=1180 RepID=UPI002FF48A17